ncbi:hypothetical protein B224_1272 [Aeromonas media WS]|nr:hypothetical protein B224_1272 [Aeromonas media WS]
MHDPLTPSVPLTAQLPKAQPILSPRNERWVRTRFLRRGGL